MDQRDFLIALNLIPNIQTKAIFELLEHYSDAGEIQSLSKEKLLEYSGIGKITADRILEFDFESHIDEEKKKAEKLDVKIYTRLDENYPYLLSQISYPPIVLYVKGQLPSNSDPCIAIVGTRKATEYGKITASKIAGELASMSHIIVSGLAHGIDSIAHHAALKAGGKTIAVLGSGMDVIYPPENRNLCNEIIKKGAVISEHPFGVKPDKRNFPIRNRIISGLCWGTLVIEASEKSGALITAKYALEQSRDLFAIPGNITQRQSIGTNYLIKEGAKLVQRVEDVLSELPSEYKNTEKYKVKKEPYKTNEVDLDDMEKQILSILRFDKPMHIDIVCALLNEEPHSIWQSLLTLEIKNMVIQLEGKMFIKNLEG